MRDAFYGGGSWSREVDDVRVMVRFSRSKISEHFGVDAYPPAGWHGGSSFNGRPPGRNHGQSAD